MALADPRDLADFYDLLPVSSVQLRLQQYQEVDGLGSGDVLVEDLADPLWIADVVLDLEQLAAARGLDALLTSVLPPRKFYLRDVARRLPALDPDGGTTLAEAEVLIHAIGDDNVSVSFEGLPANYPLSAGDFWHADFGADPVRRGFFQLLEGGSADAGGLTAELAVSTAIPPGLEAGAAVTLIDAACQMMIVPKSLESLTFRRGRADGARFQAIQRL
jgi:hypothetical protein